MDLKDLNPLKLIPRRSPQEMALLVMILLSSLSLIISLVFLVSTGLRINRTDIPPQDGQLINRVIVEQAAELIQEETVIFSEE